MSVWLNLSRQYALCGYNTVLQTIRPKVDESLLEIGCGEGRHLQRLAYRYPALDIYGLEPSERMYSAAKKRFVIQNQVQKYEHEYQIMPLAFEQDKAFDYILFSHVLAVLPNWKAALEQALLHLKPGGRLHIVEFSHLSEKAWLNVLPDSLHIPPQHDLLCFLRHLAKKTGGQLKTNYLGSQMTFVAHYQKPKQTSHQPNWQDNGLLACFDF